METSDANTCIMLIMIKDSLLFDKKGIRRGRA